MQKSAFFTLIITTMLLALVLSGCLASTAPQPTEDVNLPTRSAAATAQAEVNLLENEAYALEEDLDANFSEHYTGMLVESYPQTRVVVYLTGANKEALAPFVKDLKLFELIEVKEEALSRRALRKTREALKLEMDKAGMTYTTGIKMEPARLQVYVLNLAEAQEKLKTAGITVPEHVELIEVSYLPQGG